MRFARNLAFIIIPAVVVFLGLSTSLRNFRVDGPSMETTLVEGQRVVVNSLAYNGVFLFHADPPRRGDLVVFRSTTHPDIRLVKRVVGLPGEVVEIREGVVYADGEPLDGPYATAFREANKQYAKLQEDKYFVMGDNPSQSHDSRFWGPVPLENMVGKVWFIYWPFSDFGAPPE